MKLKESKFLAVVAAAAVVFYLLFVHGRLYGEINGSFISYGHAIAEQSIPFWSEQLSGGYPLHANPEAPLFGILNLMLWLVPDVVLAFNLATLAHMLIAGIGAALFAYELTKSKHAAVISGMAYISTGAFAFSAFTATMPFLYPLAFVPLIFLYAYKGIGGNTTRNSLIAAALLAYQIISGGTIHFLWTLLGVGAFIGTLALFSLLKPNANELKKLAAIAAILLVFTIGFSAVKLLPALEFNQLTNRADKVSYEDFIWEHTQIKASKMPSAIFGTGVTMARTGFVVFLLAASAFMAWRRKYVLALAAVALVALIIETGTPLTKLVYHLPGYDKTRQIYNVLGLFSLAMATFAGIGAANILKRLKGKETIATAAIIAAIVFELFVIGYNIQRYDYETGFDEQLEENALLQNISSDNDYSRLHLYGEDFVGLSLTKYAVPLGIRMLDWTTGNVWFNDYVQYTTIAGQQDSAKMWGMAGVKYVAAKQEISVPGLEFIGEFEKCAQCDLKASHLYENNEYLPRAYTPASSILILGQENAAQLQYQIILSEDFEPKKTAIISSDELPENLERFAAVIITRNPDASEQAQLRRYHESGGVIEPNIFEGQATIDNERLAGILGNEGSMIETEITESEPTRVVMKAKGSGFLVVSEKYYKFKDWKATVNGIETEKSKANGIATAIHAGEGDTVVFEYRLRTFYYGLIITLMSIAAALALLYFTSRRSSHHPSQPS